MLELPIMDCYATSRVNKRWREVWQDDYFWFLKVKHDYPELYLPYKNSQFKRIYKSEFRRQKLRADFKFGGSFESEPRLEHSENVDILVQNDDLIAARMAAILSNLAGFRIWNDEDEVVLYGIYADKYYFKIYGTDHDLTYVLDKDLTSYCFKEDLLELVNLTEPCYCGSELGYYTWKHISEYFNMSVRQFGPYDAFKHRHDHVETICLLEGDEKYIKRRWVLMDRTYTVNGGTQIEGTHFGRSFILYPEVNKIMLKVEPLLSNRLIDELKYILETLW